MNMPAAGSTIRTTGSAFNELVSVLLRLDPRLSQATKLGITGEGCRLGEKDARTGRRRRPSTQGGTAQHVPPDAVDLPGPWTPAERRADSPPWRGGRPPAVGNLAGDRRRPCLRWGREIPTAPQRFIII